MARVERHASIAGAGLGGLAAAIACARAGFATRVFEQAPALREFGAGIQLGPNATRVLGGWGLDGALGEIAAVPDRLVVRSAASGRELGRLPLGASMQRRYGAPYLTVHRGDLQSLLADAAFAQGAATLELAAPVDDLEPAPDQVTLRLADGRAFPSALLIGADGIWSRLRERLLADGPPRTTGHLAYRALMPQSRLPERLRSTDVSAWLGPRLHLVAYPVRRGEWLNLVAVVQPDAAVGCDDPRLRGWDHATNAAQLRAALSGCCVPLQALVQAVPAWRLWMLCDRAPMRGAWQHASGRVALVGDAAHPMRPYLAQGAGMAIEDAAELERVLAPSAGGLDVPAALRAFAARRWRRNARVQARAERNGRIFHSAGPLAWSRDAALRLLGERLLDVGWLYRG